MLIQEMAVLFEAMGASTLTLGKLQLSQNVVVLEPVFGDHRVTYDTLPLLRLILLPLTRHAA